jgi:DNA-binding NarL/FixJ family response regulator
MRDAAVQATRTIRVLVVDDHRTFTELLSLALAGEPDIECVGVAGTGAQAVQLAARLRPDVVVMDIQMPDQDGLAATRRLREVSPGTAVAIVTAHRDPDWVVRAAQAGASAFVPKDGSLTEMLDAIRCAQPGAMRVSPSTFPTTAPAAPRPGDPPPPALTPREREVLALMGRGLAPREIARVLGISLHTCRGYVKSLHMKLDVRSQLEAVVRGQQLGLIEPPDER